MICNTIGLTADSFETLYVHGGAEVAEVYGGIGYAQPIFYKSRTLTGATSYSFMAYHEPLTDYEISGNMVQSGTPTPTSPIYPQETGDRSQQLLDISTATINLRDAGDSVTKTVSGFILHKDYSPIQEIACIYFIAPATGDYSLSASVSGDTGILDSYGMRVSETTPESIPSKSSEKVVSANAGDTIACIFTANAGFTGTIAFDKIMLNRGSTPLQFEPYGYKLQLELGGNVQNLFLAEPIRQIGNYVDVAKSVNEAVRKINKLVLTGDEQSLTFSSYDENRTVCLLSYIPDAVKIAGVCSHIKWKTTYSTTEYNRLAFGTVRQLYISIDNSVLSTAGSLSAFRQYLANEYAAGHPVTIWYVLAEEQTETITSPILTPTTGNNTLSVGTTLAPSNVSITGHIKPIEYKRLSYIKSTGTQYIQTDIVPSYSDKVEMDVQFGSEVHTSYNSGLTIGYYDNDYGALTVAFDSSTSSGNTGTAIFYVGFKWYSGIGSNHIISNVDVTNRSTVTLQRGTSSWGASTCTVSETITASDPSTGMPIFGCNVANNIRPFDKRDMSLYEFKLYDSNNTLTHDLVPVERFDGVLGLLDEVTNKFYTNAGSGDFIKGEYVNS